MSLSKKQLQEMKNKLKEKDQNAISKIRNAKGLVVRQTKDPLVKKGLPKKKSIVRWNYKVNDLVKVSNGSESVGLVVSNFEYFSKKVEKNCFFVLVDNYVRQIDGRYLRLV